MSQQFSSDDLFQLLQNLLPPGIAFPRDPNSTQSKLLKALADAESPTVGRSANLLVDSFPATSAELLPEWEETLGLPDPCVGPAPTLEQRQKAVVTRLTATGGQSIPYFIKYAESLGYPGTTFTEFAAYRVGMRVGLPMAGEGWEYALQVNGVNQYIHLFRCGHDTTGTPFAYWDNNALFCELKKVLPAHLYILFNIDTDTGTPFPNQGSIQEVSSQIAETVTAFVRHRAAMLEHAAITDLPNAATLTGHSGDILESAIIAEAAVGLGHYKRFQQEASIISSTQDGQRNVIHETAAIADAVAVATMHQIAARAETGAITSTQSALRQLLASEAETGALSDVVRVTTAHYLAAIAETSAISEITNAQSNFIHETASAITASVTALQGFKAAMVETAAISDATNKVTVFLVDPVTGNFILDPVTGNKIIDPHA